jgi:hypothetical protein
MSMEPYGIGIDKQYALQSGILTPVRYFNRYPSRGNGVEEGAAWQFQSYGIKSDWRAEKEYRCRGDIDLSALPKEKLLCICFRADEAAEIESMSGVRAVSFYPAGERQQ